MSCPPSKWARRRVWGSTGWSVPPKPWYDYRANPPEEHCPKDKQQSRNTQNGFTGGKLGSLHILNGLLKDCCQLWSPATDI